MLSVVTFVRVVTFVAATHVSQVGNWYHVTPLLLPPTSGNWFGYNLMIFFHWLLSIESEVVDKTMVAGMVNFTSFWPCWPVVFNQYDCSKYSQYLYYTGTFLLGKFWEVKLTQRKWPVEYAQWLAMVTVWNIICT